MRTLAHTRVGIIVGVHRRAGDESERREYANRLARFMRILIHDEVDIRRETRIPVENRRHTADDDVADRSVLERSEDGFEQGHGQRRRTRDLVRS